MKNNIKESWMHKYSLAKAYFEYHGNLEISQSYKTLNGYEYSEKGRTDKFVRRNRNAL